MQFRSELLPFMHWNYSRDLISYKGVMHQFQSILNSDEHSFKIIQVQENQNFLWFSIVFSSKYKGKMSTVLWIWYIQYQSCETSSRGRWSDATMDAIQSCQALLSFFISVTGEEHITQSSRKVIRNPAVLPLHPKRSGFFVLHSIVSSHCIWFHFTQVRKIKQFGWKGLT